MDHTFWKMCLENGSYIWENVSGKWTYIWENVSGKCIIHLQKCLWKMDHTFGKMSLENGSYIWENVPRKWIIHWGKCLWKNSISYFQLIPPLVVVVHDQELYSRQVCILLNKHSLSF